MWFLIVACVGSAFAVSYCVTWIMRWLSPRVGLIDRPAARKVHKVPTPLGGGVGIWAGVVIPLAAAELLIALWGKDIPEWVPHPIAEYLPGVLERSRSLWTVIAAGSVLAIMGLIDDKRPLPWKPRMAIQFLIATAVAWCGVRATVFVDSPWYGGFLTVLWIVFLVNSFNFLDNMDGLSSGIALIVSSQFALIMLTRDDGPRWLVAGFFLVLAGAIIGFLCHNWHPARIFMGDSGSYFLGCTIACMTVLGTFYSENDQDNHVILAPLCVLAIPLYDTISVIWIRLKEGRSPFQPDRKHFSHRLVALGLPTVRAVLTVHLATLTTGLCGVALYRVPGWKSASLLVGIVACVLVIIAILESAPRPPLEQTQKPIENDHSAETQRMSSPQHTAVSADGQSSPQEPT